QNGQGGVSALYSVDFTNGNAFVTQGRVPPGRVLGPNPFGTGQPLDSTSSTRHKTTTDFGGPGLLVTFTDTSFGASVTGRNINSLLSQANHATAKEVVDAINQNAAAFVLVQANSNGVQNLDVITPLGGGQAIDVAQPNPMVLNDGATPTTVQDLLTAINGNS